SFFSTPSCPPRSTSFPYTTLFRSVLVIDGDGPPRIDHLELGLVVLARRIHPRLEQWLQKLRERWNVRRSARQIVPWSKVRDLTRSEERRVGKECRWWWWARQRSIS